MSSEVGILQWLDASRRSRSELFDALWGKPAMELPAFAKAAPQLPEPELDADDQLRVRSRRASDEGADFDRINESRKAFFDQTFVFGDGSAGEVAAVETDRLEQERQAATQEIAAALVRRLDPANLAEYPQNWRYLVDLVDATTTAQEDLAVRNLLLTVVMTEQSRRMAATEHRGAAAGTAHAREAAVKTSVPLPELLDIEPGFPTEPTLGAITDGLSDFDRLFWQIVNSVNDRNLALDMQRLRGEQSAAQADIGQHEWLKQLEWDALRALEAAFARIAKVDAAPAVPSALAFADTLVTADPTQYVDQRARYMKAASAAGRHASPYDSAYLMALLDGVPTRSRAEILSDPLVKEILRLHGQFVGYDRIEVDLQRLQSAEGGSTQYPVDITSLVSTMSEIFLEIRKRRLYIEPIRRGIAELGEQPSGLLWQELTVAAPHCLIGPISSTVENVQALPEYFDIAPGCEHRAWSGAVAGTAPGQMIDDSHLGGLDRAYWEAERVLTSYESAVAVAEAATTDRDLIADTAAANEIVERLEIVAAAGRYDLARLRHALSQLNQIAAESLASVTIGGRQ